MIITMEAKRIITVLFSIIVAVGYCQAQRLQELVLSNEDVAGKRVLVIGDIHGCFDELLQLLQEANMIDISDNSLVEDAMVLMVGDFTNKGPYSLEVLQWLMTQNSYEKAYAVTGNNELDPDEWYEQTSPEEKVFMDSLPYSISVPTYNVRVVHAGMMPNWPIQDQTEYIMTLMRNLEDDNQGGWIPHEETDDGENWGTVYSKESINPEFIVYGHDARRGHDEDGNIVIQEHEYATGLDTRCVSGGELTGLLLRPPFRTYYKVQCEEYDFMQM